MSAETTIPDEVKAALLAAEGKELPELVASGNKALPEGWGLGFRRGRLRLVSPEGRVWDAVAIAGIYEADATAEARAEERTTAGALR